MVLKKRLDYGFKGFQVPFIPRAPRSARRRGPYKKIAEDGQTCAFELLASLAGKLLRETESSSSSSHASEGNVQPAFSKSILKQERIDEDKPLKADANKCSLKDAMDKCVNSPPLIDSNSTTKSPFCMESIPKASFSGHGNDIKLGCRDDDEKFSRFDKVSTKSRAFRHPQHIAYRRIRKLLTSKYWKVAPKLKDCELSRPDVGVKPIYHKRKTCYIFERCQHANVVKRRKFFDQTSVVTSDGGFSSESVTNSPDKGTHGNKSGSATILGGASGLSSSVLGHQASFHSKDSHALKFSIKSFRVPELYMEVPETATVGSLKRTVMEAVTAILGGGLRVGVLLKGKKVRDDNRTLLQTVPEILTRSPESHILDTGFPDPLLDSYLTKTGNLVEDNRESFSSHTGTRTDNITSDSRPLASVPARSTEALAVVPVGQKTRRSDLVQRRTRRPFSVSEVEAVVHAVVELGTGRWRDVKLRAFENADHRTYVDLKDKWKTLVHTAKISPQQRRGDPVPQELLDRVLAAHSYWSQRQGKQHVKHQAGNSNNSEASTERLGVEGVTPIVMM
ncbi:Telomere repeat-binding protein [Quillaja saponaria]|uniref:Telomere repeat-binding protein n=1 Tax=Quillaja saponaria TaxID=32244 RepID=A0AAD7PLF8_QUISA|nr:Telomere repeat-binding protein [Quillaja saponaria]